MKIKFLAILLVMCIFLLNISCLSALASSYTFVLNNIGDGYIFTGYNGIFDTCIIPEEYDGLPVVGIAERAFYGKYNLKEIEIPDTVVSIGDDAFVNCSKLQSLYIPAYVEYIGVGITSGCENLANITVSESNLKYYDEGNYIVSTKDKAVVAGCKNSVFSENVDIDMIFDYAFYDCDGLGDVALPSSVKNIGSYAFAECSDLKSISIPDSIEVIHQGAFYNCSSLIYNSYENAEYLGNDNNPDLVLIKPASLEIVSCKINDNTKIIYPDAFEDCNKLSKIEISSNVTFIGYNSFGNCDSLNDIIVSEDNSVYYSVDNCIITKDKKLVVGNKNGDIPVTENITEIGICAFSNCNKIERIVIPNTVKSINDSAFAGCKALIEVVLSDSLTEIGAYAFSYCSSLVKISFPDSLTTIKYCAFEQCYALESIFIPDDVTSLSTAVFWGCTNLRDVYCEASCRPVGWADDWLLCRSSVHWGEGTFGIFIDDLEPFEESTYVSIETIAIDKINQTFSDIFTHMFAYDFSAISKEGNNEQPSEKLVVSFPIPSEFDGIVEVYYVSDNGLYELIDTNIDETCNTIQASIEHFSIYVVANRTEFPDTEDVETEDISSEADISFDISEDAFDEISDIVFDDSSSDQENNNETDISDDTSTDENVDTSDNTSDVPVKSGDINANDKIDMTDYILLKRAYFGTYTFTEEQNKIGDINKNNKIDMTDYILLKRVYFGTYTIK